MKSHIILVYCIAFLFFKNIIPITSQNDVHRNLFIDFLCHKTDFTDFCKTTMYSDSRSENADIFTIGDIIFDLINQNASEITIFIKQKIRKAYPGTKKGERLKSCKLQLLELRDDLSDAKSLWHNRELRKLKDLLHGADSKIFDACIVHFFEKSYRIVFEPLFRFWRIMKLSIELVSTPVGEIHRV